jgi:hypothetical protein
VHDRCILFSGIVSRTPLSIISYETIIAILSDTLPASLLGIS